MSWGCYYRCFVSQDKEYIFNKQLWINWVFPTGSEPKEICYCLFWKYCLVFFDTKSKVYLLKRRKNMSWEYKKENENPLLSSLSRDNYNEPFADFSYILFFSVMCLQFCYILNCCLDIFYLTYCEHVHTSLRIFSFIKIAQLSALAR